MRGLLFCEEPRISLRSSRQALSFLALSMIDAPPARAARFLATPSSASDGNSSGRAIMDGQMAHHPACPESFPASPSPSASWPVRRRAFAQHQIRVCRTPWRRSRMECCGTSRPLVLSCDRSTHTSGGGLCQARQLWDHLLVTRVRRQARRNPSGTGSIRNRSRRKLRVTPSRPLRRAIPNVQARSSPARGSAPCRPYSDARRIRQVEPNFRDDAGPGHRPW